MDDTDPLGPLLARYEAFLDEVAGLDRALAGRGAGTPWQPALDEHGRMHREVWEARREVQRRSAAAGLYAPHMPEEVGGLGLSRVDCMRVEELVYRRAGLGLGL
ncbi:MAG TPA: acyl-CoA dehydrogenase family protein, partial [Miltoncostaea sp.]|nr:acyl-CoA dehydrogenase family protein [Miltoncostaea sp.]